MAAPDPREARALSDTAPLQLVGYWHASDDDGLPHPQQLVRPRWEWRRRRRILRYLRHGVSALQYRGWSYCRFGCRRPNGRQELTDGTWVWPEGLAHYVSVHGVSLPDAFVAHMAAHAFTVPPSISPTHHSREVSDDLWRAWAARQRPYRAMTSCDACQAARADEGLTWPQRWRIDVGPSDGTTDERGHSGEAIAQATAEAQALAVDAGVTEDQAHVGPAPRHHHATPTQAPSRTISISGSANGGACLCTTARCAI